MSTRAISQAFADGYAQGQGNQFTRPGQVWKDSDGDTWTVQPDHLLQLDKDMSPDPRSFRHVRESFGPLQLVEGSTVDALAAAYAHGYEQGFKHGGQTS